MARTHSSGARISFWLLVGIVVAVLLLAAFMSRRREIPVRAESARSESITSSIATNGKVEALNNFEAHAPAATTVKRVLVQSGEQVRAGQLLIQLDDADARAQAAKSLAQVKAAQADLNAVQTGGTQEEVLTTRSDLIKARADRDAAQRNLDALRRLQQTGAASPGEVQDAENRLKTADAAVSLLESKLSGRYSNSEISKTEAALAEARDSYQAAQDLLLRSSVVAPSAGTVYALPVKAGTFVNTGDLLVEVANLSQVQVRTYVDEPDIGRLAPGQAVEVTWDAMPGRTWQGKVTQTPSRVVLFGTRNVGEITCAVDNRDAKLLPGVNVNVSIITARRDQAITVSREAVHQEDGHRFVYEIVEGELKPQDVTTAISNLTRIQVTQGLQPGTDVALGSLNGTPLRPGLAVKVVQP